MKPPFAYARLCRSRDQGRLGSIDPQAQQLCLQTRWIQQLLQPSSTCFSHEYLTDFFHRFHSTDTVSLLGLVFPSYHASMDLHLGVFGTAFFTAYDALSSSDHIIPHCSIMTLIHLPVACIFVDVPLGHWLNKKRCTPLLVSHFLNMMNLCSVSECWILWLMKLHFLAYPVNW